MKNLKKDQYYVEPFCGGCGMLYYIDHPYKIGADSNEYVIEMWKGFQHGFMPPKELTYDEYVFAKNDYLNQTNKCSKAYIGYVGNACSYGGAWWNGYAKYNPKKKENHILEAYNGTIKQIINFKYFKETSFIHSNYDKLYIPKNSFLYLDPPYQNTKSYKDKFNSDLFWDWCRNKINCGNLLLISEYNAPSDFICIWSKTKKDGMGTTKVGNKQKDKIEKLFVHKSQVNLIKL